MPELKFIFLFIEYWAEKTPNKVAVTIGDKSWTYQEVDQITSGIAKTLIQMGIKPADKVAFILPRSAETIFILIGILKAAATYVPLAANFPISRIKDCIEDSNPYLVIVSDDFQESSLFPNVIRASELFAKLSNGFDRSFEIPSLLGEEDVAYIIFTSGTTGRPKGVPIRHESLYNFVKGNQEVCIRVTSDDKVLQCFSTASDGHIEEIWPTFMAGATLIVASDAETYDGTALASLMNRHGVTIISCAPTLLSMVEDEIPSLKRILFGAENLPMPIVQRWSKDGREIINTYGPTEATVGATYSICRSDKAINIGKPLPGYFCYILDSALEEVEEGELCIAGVGVSKGYLGRENLNESNFIKNPYGKPENKNEILYKTGDLVKLDSNRNLVWLSRIDGQIKIRGYRVELSEIETVLLSDPAIRSGVVIPRINEKKDTYLVALLVPRNLDTINLVELISRLNTVLPDHMIPREIEIIENIPKLASGKIDRKTCTTLKGIPLRIEREIIPPRTLNEHIVLGVLNELFPNRDISCVDDFFTDLGGYSLLASRFISIMRSEKGFQNLSVVNIYENPTVRSFAALLDSESSTEIVSNSMPRFKDIPAERYYLAKIIQLVAVLFLFGVQGIFWVGPIIAAIYLSDIDYSDFSSLLFGLFAHMISIPLMFALVIASKWIVGGRFKEGNYPLWGFVFLRWWFVDRMLAIAPVSYISGTPLASLYLRLLGAKVGENVYFESLEISAPDLITIGDNCSFENSSWLLPAEVAHGELHLRRINISDGCIVGVRSGVTGGASMEEGSALQDLSCIGSGKKIPKDEEWVGASAQKSKKAKLPPYDKSKQPDILARRIFGISQILLIPILAGLELLPFATVSFTLYNHADPLTWYLYEPLYGIILLILSCIQAIVIKWIILGRYKEGTQPFPGWYALRKWFHERHFEQLSIIFVPIYDSLFARPWCRLLGMKCGPRCEIALPLRLPYDLVELGEESFIASQVSIGMPIRRNSEVTYEKTFIGRRVFLGNDSVVPQGTHISDEFLLGVLSLCPSSEHIMNGQQQAWLGSPPFKMPRRHIDRQFDEQRTYSPPLSLYLQRLMYETIRIILPGIFWLFMASAIIEGLVAVWNETSLPIALLSLPIIYFVSSIAAACLVWMCKKILIGVYKPNTQPLWSTFVWRVETYSAILHDFGVPTFITPLLGTWFMPMLMRFLGARVGERTFINTTDWTETDLIDIGEDVAINAHAPLQAHLFEDRVMKVGPISIQDRSTVGIYSVVLCDSKVKADAHIGPQSLVMKGETIPSNSYWVGSPSQKASFMYE